MTAKDLRKRIKESLFYALVLPDLRAMALQSQEIAAGQAPGHEKLKRLAECSVAFYARLNPLLTVMLAEAQALSGRNAETERLNEVLREATAAIIRQGVDDGLVEADSAEVAASVFWYMGRVLFYFSPERFAAGSGQAMAEEIIRLFLHGFGQQQCPAHGA